MVWADYVFQTVAGEAFDTVTTDVVWTNDAGQTGFPIDDDYQLVNIGFTFYLGETAYTQVRINGNGSLHFGADQGFHKDYTNEALPITGFINGPGFEEAADRVIAGYWDDLEPSLGGTVRYDTFGTAPNRRFVASWEGVPEYNGPATSYSFQIVIYENGNVRFRYGNDDVDGSSATIGIEVDNSDFTQFSFNTSSVGDANDILWIREFPALVSATATCTDTDTVTVNFASAVSPARAADPSNFSIDNGVTISNATYINATTVELTTSTLTSGVTYTLSTTFPTQSITFQLGTITTDTFVDNFSSASFGNNDGTQNWSANWIESFDDGSASDINGRVFISGGELFMNDSPNSGTEPSMEREADLSGYISATLSFDYRTSNNLENSDRFDISISSNGGASYTVLQSYSNDVNGSDSFDITAFISANTRVRLRIENNYGGGTENIIIDDVTITAQRVEVCTPLIDHFVIAHDNNGINCLREPITITAVDSGGATLADYTGTVNLSLTTNNGNWFTTDEGGSSADLAQGTLTDTPGDNDGAATYQFDATDLGTVVLYLEDTIQETTNISVAEGGITDDNTEGDITFRPAGFVFSPSPINTQVAGKPFDITLTAAGQTPTQPQCGVIEEYTGVQSLNFWSEYTNPVTSPTQVVVDSTSIATDEVSSSAQNVTFSSGVATISVSYSDVGIIALNAKDTSGIGEPGGSGDELIGGIVPFVVRPFGYDIQINTDPYADDGNDAVFTSAGNTFVMTVRSVNWQAADDTDDNGIPDPFIDTDANGIPDSGGDLSDNTVTPNIANTSGSVGYTPTALVVTNSNGVLGNTSSNVTSFIAPGLANEATITFNQSWSEVGILQIDALTTNFMSGGENVTGQRINIGRFIPDNFLITSPTIPTQCGAFTYGGFADGINVGLNKNGQTFPVSGTVTARNSANAATFNYAGVFAKLTAAGFSVQAYDDTAATNASGQVNFNPAALAFGAGVSNYSDTSSDYQFDSLIAPFNLRLDLTATDSDGVTSGISSSNSFEVRLGRLRLIDTYGPETSDLEMRLNSEYFNGSGWQINAADSCTTYIQTDAAFDAATYTDNLSAGETSIFSPATTQTLANGVSSIANGIWFSAPGNNNYGSVIVNYNTATQGWLGFDWDNDNNLEQPSGLLSFGYYRGSDRVIYWREVRN